MEGAIGWLGVPPEKAPEGVDRLYEEMESARRAQRDRRKEDLGAVASRLASDAQNLDSVGGVTIVRARVDLDRTELAELSRLLSREPNRVVLLAAEREGRGTLFVGSTASRVPANALVEHAKARFQGKGGGSASAATAVGEPGAPLATALEDARAEARRLAGSPTSEAEPTGPGSRGSH